ncbi:integrase catalytic domain-containing protein [Nephila pilipes]|uniref:Integrase catalytic domain-containing protein n=1 Tax=Nephila pilipes TaxID=299642 RepID=A0A8X6R6X0_NEPPI|nr:integrase catalytic domain-containing protein [Nephila pilipes]
MANTEALRKSRKHERAAFTKVYNRVEELTALEGVDICELEAKLNVFNFLALTDFGLTDATSYKSGKYSGVVHVNLLAAKSKVAPVKTFTILRLELLAATVGARLCKTVLSAFQWDNVKQHYWTDSTMVLSWIQREEFWSIFVNNSRELSKEIKSKVKLYRCLDIDYGLLLDLQNIFPQQPQHADS